MVEATLHGALAGRSAGELAGQLQYALDNRMLIERAVGFVVARTGVDAVEGFNVLRSVARSRRRKVAEVAQEVLETGSVPTPER